MSDRPQKSAASESREPARYADADQELRSVLELLFTERAAEEEEFRKEWLTLPIARRRALGVTLHPIEFLEATGTLGERWKLRFQFAGPTAGARGGTGHRFHAGQVVEVFRAAKDGATTGADARETISGVLAEVRNDRLIVITEDAPDWLEDGRIGVNLAFNVASYREMERALREIIDNRKLASRRDRLLGYSPARKLNLTREVKTADDMATRDALARRLTRAQLNAAQAEAVLGVLALEPGDFAIIHGPPGTGKTTTVVSAIAELLRRGERVLVTAPTNAAADLLAERLLECFADHAAGLSGKKLLRLGHPARVSETIWRHTLEGSVDAHPDAKTAVRYRSDADALYKKARKYRRQFGPTERTERQAMLKEHAELRKLIRSMEQGIVRHVVDTADVIVTTLVGAAADRIKNVEFDAAIVDEATQALEPAAWIPILRAPKIVMAGDHCQLPPTLRAAHQLSNTLFEKIITRHSAADADCIFFLDTQYRMEPGIVAFSNQAFYQDRLVTHESILARAAVRDLPLEFLSPLVFVDTAGCDFLEEQEAGSESFCNPGEGRLLAAILETLAPAWLSQGLSIGIIATYRDQITHLRETLGENLDAYATEISGDTGTFEIDTVDAFQGRENDLICISLVRSNDAGETGFLGETRRMNVALTRARRLLIVVGDSATLASHPFYEKFLKHAEADGDYRSAYEFLEIV